jgi:hypothetical protein
VGPKTKQWKKKKVEAHSLTWNTLKVGGHARALRCDYDEFTNENSR